MEYKGKLYAKIANKYLEISHTDDFEALEGQVCRLQNNLVVKEETNAELRQTIIAKTQREAKLESMLADHQDFTQWLDEQIDDDCEVAHDFIKLLVNRLHKINN